MVIVGAQGCAAVEGCNDGSTSAECPWNEARDIILDVSRRTLLFERLALWDIATSMVIKPSS